MAVLQYDFDWKVIIRSQAPTTLVRRGKEDFRAAHARNDVAGGANLVGGDDWAWAQFGPPLGRTAWLKSEVTTNAALSPAEKALRSLKQAKIFAPEAREKWIGKIETQNADQAADRWERGWARAIPKVLTVTGDVTSRNSSVGVAFMVEGNPVRALKEAPTIVVRTNTGAQTIRGDIFENHTHRAVLVAVIQRVLITIIEAAGGGQFLTGLEITTLNTHLTANLNAVLDPLYVGTMVLLLPPDLGVTVTVSTTP